MRLIVSLFVFMLFTQAVFAAEPSTKLKKTKKPVKAAAWKPVEFDENVEKLPAGYTGIDAKQFYKMFKARVNAIKKGEFESSEEFTQRTADKDALLSPINTTDLYAFKMAIIKSKYNADIKAYRVDTEYGERCHDTGDYDGFENWMTCNVVEISKSVSGYRGSNAYGASSAVRSYMGLNFALAMHKTSPLIGTTLSKNYAFGEDYDYKATVPFPIEKAKIVKDGVSVLFVGRVIDAVSIKGRGFFQEPTISNPTSIIIKEEAVPFELKHIIYYVAKTGEIISKQSF